MKRIAMIALLLACGYGVMAQVPILSPTEVRPLEWLNDQAEREYKEAKRIEAKKSKGLALTAKEETFFSSYDDYLLQFQYGYIRGEDDYTNCATPIHITASSTLKDQGPYSYAPAHAHDNSYTSVWCEGAKGYGIGEHIEYTFAANAPRITRIIVTGGHVKSPAAWKNNSRPKQLKLYVNGSPMAILNLKDERAEQTFAFDTIGRTGNKTWTMRFEIVDVYKGDKWDDVVISEINFEGPSYDASQGQ